MRNILTLSAVVLCCAAAMASPVTPDQALARLKSDAPLAAPAVTASMTRLSESLPELYVFTTGAEGFMILPADDCAPALLGYSPSGSFDHNPALDYWLETYAREIKYAAASGSSDSDSFTRTRPVRQAIEPMTATRWNQGAPYNDSCPELNGRRCVTGCVATAMAQVLKYHNYPAKGTGTHSYSWLVGKQTLSFNYGETTFDWEHMTDTYSSSSTATEKAAVATLMRACGISVNMSYTASESGAVSRHLCPALIDNFGYDRALWMPERNYYGLIEWEDLIYADLAEGLPVLYGGQGSAGGHQFVCDGYSSDGYFHFNWGWGGMSDGYFLLTALDPPALGIGGGAGGFNYDQSVAIGVRPAQAGSDYTYVVYCTGSFSTSATSFTVGSEISFTGGYYNFSFANLPEGSKFGIKITDESGITTYAEGQSANGLRPLSGYSEITVTIPQTLADGTYTLTPAVKINGSWDDIRVTLSGNPSYIATIADGNVTLADPDAPQISAANLTMTSDLYWGNLFAMDFTIANAADEEYYGAVIPILISPDSGSMVAQGDEFPIDVPAEQSVTYSYSGSFSASSTPAAGEYYLGLLSASTGRLLGEPILVTLNAAPTQTSIAVDSFSVITPTPVADPSSIQFSAEVSCSSGYYAGTLTLAVFHASGGQSIYSKTSPAIYIGEGETRTITIDTNMLALTDGYYMAALYHGSQQISSMANFQIQTSDSLSELPAPADKTVTIFDLQGRRIANPTHGLYIIDGHKHIR